MCFRGVHYRPCFHHEGYLPKHSQNQSGGEFCCLELSPLQSCDSTHRLHLHTQLSFTSLGFNYDVIWKNWSYGGANNVFLDQLFPYIYIQRLFLNCAESEKSDSRRCLYVTKSLGSDQTPHRMRGV